MPTRTYSVSRYVYETREVTVDTDRLTPAQIAALDDNEDAMDDIASDGLNILIDTNLTRTVRVDLGEADQPEWHYSRTA